MMCECKLILCAFLVINVIMSCVFCFNIDQVNYAVYGTESRSMFGFTVAVHKDRLNRGWVLVGAPEAQSVYQDPGMVVKGGAVYKCSSEGDNGCEEVPFDRQNNVFMGQTNMLDEKSGRWFGATLSTSGQTNGPIVACAPRYVWFTKTLTRRDPVGTCFVSNGEFDNFEEYSPCRTMNWGYHRQGSCQAGFSAAINKVGDRLYVGAPGSYYWQGQMYSVDAHARFNYTPGVFGNLGYGAKGSVHQQSLENRPAVFSTREGEQKDDDSYIGYSTVVGHFKENEKYEGVAVGMPRGNRLRGKVLLFTWDLKNYKNITVSKQIGSYFGYSIAAADVNGDKKLDLIVGAPMHTEPNTEDKYDVGRVYVLYQSNNFLESYNVSHHIDGFNSKSRFGHSVASLGDLNQDGFDDFAVGAPYGGPGGRGAVYIYYGSAEGIRKKYGQVIYAEDIQTGRGLLSTFGFSVTGGMDLDGNEYPDMAVGAYLSDAAFFFRSRPVVRVDGFVRFQTAQKQIDIKQKNCKLSNGQDATCTAIDFCIRYSGKGIPEEIDLLVRYVLDSKKPNTPRMGFVARGSSTFNETLRLYKDNRDFCKTQQVYVKNEIRDKLTPLEAEVQYFMVDYSQSAYDQFRNPKSQLKPVLDLNNPPSKKDSISIQKNCGPDNVCIPNLLVDVTSSVEKYLLGSDKDLEFDVIVSNLGEDSFETTFEIKYPERIFYKKTESKPNMPAILCSPSENRTVICDIGNPLPSGKIATFKMLFQPHKEEGMAPSYEFDVFVNSTNPEAEETIADNHKHISIGIWIDASLELRGESYPSTVHYNESLYTATNITRESEIGPQVTHVYYLTNRGPATVQEAEIFLLWPLTTLGGEDLLYLLDQPHTQGNVKCDAALSNYKHYNLDYHRATIWDRLKIDTSGVQTSASAERLAAGKTTEIGRGVSSGVGVINVNKDVTVQTGDSSQLFEARHKSSSNVNTFGHINANGDYEYTEARYTTTWQDGQPITRWENVTTVKDASGKILRTYLSKDDSQQAPGQAVSQTGGAGLNFGNINANGEFVHTEARYTTTYDADGVPITTWHNVTTVRDASGKILRTFHSDDEGSSQSGGRFETSSESFRSGSGASGTSSSIHGSSRFETSSKNFSTDSRSGFSASGSGSSSSIGTQEETWRLQEERRRQEELRRQEDERKREEEIRRKQQYEYEMKMQEQKRKQEEERRLQLERTREEQERRRLEQEVEQKRRNEAELRRQEELRLQREKELRVAEEKRRQQSATQSTYEERRYQTEAVEAERRRIYEAELRRQEQLRLAEERRRQQSVTQTSYDDRRQGHGYESDVAEDERRRQHEALLRQRQDEARRRKLEEEERRRAYEEQQRRRYEQESRAGSESSYRLGGGSREGGSSHYGGQRVQTGYFDERGVYHDLPRGSSDSSGGVIYNRTYTFESSTSIPIDLAGGSSHGLQHNLGDISAGHGFTVHTLDLGEGAVNLDQSASAESGHSQSQSGVSSSSSSGQSSGGYRREWKTGGTFSGSGHLPPVLVNNRLGDGDNVPANSEHADSRYRVRGKRELPRDPYAEMQALIKCNSTNCVYIRCVVGVLEKDREIAIALRSRLNVRAVKDITSDQPIKVSSMMVGKISKLPYVGETTEQVYRKHEIFTEIPAKEAELVPEVAPLWIYVVSAVAGIVMLLLLIWLLSKCGFFKRNRPSPSPERQPLNRNGYHSGDEAL